MCLKKYAKYHAIINLFKNIYNKMAVYKILLKIIIDLNQVNDIKNLIEKTKSV